MQELRPYQAASVGAFYDALEMDYSRILLTLPTGTGKTTTFADIIKKWLEYFEGGVLVLAHRMELLEQAQTRIIGHCGLDPFWDIGLEIGDQRASQQAKVVCGSVLTVKNKNRLQWFKPGLIITDEAHRAAARSYQMIYERFGVIEGTCKHLGVTATPKRFDKQSLFAITPTGDSVQIYDKKARKTLPADKKTSVFEYLCYEFSLLDAITQGWLVPVRGVCISTDTDLTNVESDSEDFNNRELAKAVDNANRTNLAISKWKEIASDRPTIVFCAGIEHAYHSAELWREAGYTAEALGGEEAQDKERRKEVLNNFVNGRTQVICNMGIWTEGTDLPLASCAVMLRPTKAWNLYVQMAGRVLRSLTGILDPWQKGTNTDRKNAIAASSKPDALILDLVDITKNNGELCAVPSLVDLPANLDLEEQSLEKVKELLDEFAEVKDKVIGQCPIRFSELKAKLEQVNLMLRSEAKTVRDWKVTDRGYKFTHTPPGYSVELTEEPGGWKLQVKSPQGILYDKIGHPRNEFSEYLDRAVLVATEVVERAQAEKPKVDRGTLQRLSKAQIWHLQRKGHSCEEIAYMPMAKAKALLARYVPEYQAQKASQVSIEKITTETDI